MENVRSALNRATRQKNMPVATATDEEYFYVWRTEPNKSQASSAGIPEKRQGEQPRGDDNAEATSA